MFTIIYVVIFGFVDLLFLADKVCAEAFIVKPLELGTSGRIPCDHVENVTEIRLVQWYKSTRIDEFQNGDPSLAWWAEGESGSLPNYHMETTTFSLIINTATLEDEGLYKCSVVRDELSKGSNYFTRTFIYAVPRMDPKITLDTDSNHVRCTVEHVKPVIYPVFNFHWSPESTETYAVLNEDGTYTTSVSCAVPQNKSLSQVDCSFSYLHYQRVGSLDLLDTTTDGLIEDKTTTVSPMDTSVTFEDDGCRTTDQTECIVLKISVGLLSGVSFIMLIIMLFICLMLRRKCQGVQKSNITDSMEKMIKPAMEMEVEETGLEVDETKVV